MAITKEIVLLHHKAHPYEKTDTTETFKKKMANILCETDDKEYFIY